MHIPVWSTVKASFQKVWHTKREWGRVASASLLLWGIGIFSFLMAAFLATEGEGMSEKMAWFMYGLCFFVAIPVLEISGFRYAVLGDRKEKWWAFNLNKRFFKFLVYYFLVGGLLSLLWVGSFSLFFELTLWESNVIPETVGAGAISGVIVLYVTTRLSLLKLLISIDSRQPLSTSWRLLKGNVLRVLAIAFLAGLPTIIGAFFIALGRGAIYQMSGDQLFAHLVLLVGGVLWLWGWATLTQAYAYVFEIVSKENQQ